MKKVFLALGLLPLFAACADTAQGKLRQAVFDADSAYHALANPMPDVMAGKVPGVALTDTQKDIAKRGSQFVFNEIQSLETSLRAAIVSRRRQYPLCRQTSYLLKHAGQA